MELAFRAWPAESAAPMEDTQQRCSMSSAEQPRQRQEALPNWVRGRLLGAGSFGRVNAAVDTSTGSLFAVKSVFVAPDAPRRNVNLRALENEIHFLSSLPECPEIVRFLGSSWTREDTEGGNTRLSRNLHLELASGGSIAGLLKDMGGRGLAEPLLRRYSRDVTQALHFLHTRGIVHGDVKGLNILITDTSAKLADFGTAWRVDASGAAPADHKPPSPKTPTPLPLARLLFRSSSMHTVSRSVSSQELHAVPSRDAGGCASLDISGQDKGAGTGGTGGFRREQRRELKGSPYWMSPETVRERTDQSCAVDIWSLGCSVLEMATGRAPWSEVTGGLCAVLYAIGCTDRLPNIPEDLPSLVKDFICCCLQRNPEERWTAGQLLHHPFLAGSPGSVLTGSSALFNTACKRLHSNAETKSTMVENSALGSTHRRTLSCQGRPDPVLMLDCLATSSGGCSSVGASTSPGSKPNRKRGFSPLGCMVLEKAQSACKDQPAPSESALPTPCLLEARGSEFSPKRKRAGEDDTMTSSVPLLNLSLLRNSLPAAAALHNAPAWPNSPLSQQGAGWIVVHSPRRGFQKH